MVSLVTGFFTCAKPSSSSSSAEESIPWEDICGSSSGRDPRIFLLLFDKMQSARGSERPWTRRRKRPPLCHAGGDAYRLGDFPDYHKLSSLMIASRACWISQLHPLGMSFYPSVTTKLEACVRGVVEVQSFSLWSIATMFEFLKDSNCVSEDSVFRQLIASMTRALITEANTTFSLQEFLQQTRHESYVSHLPGSTHPSVKHALLSTPSSLALLSKDVILALLTQVKDDSQLSLLRNLSSLKSGGEDDLNFLLFGFSSPGFFIFFDARPWL